MPRNNKKQPAGDSDVESPSSPKSSFPIVGIGGSAGAVAALKDFFSALPADSGMAFLVVQHFAPTQTSTLSEQVSRAARVPVVIAAEGAVVEPNRVYVITPNVNLTIEHGRLHLTPLTASENQRTTIDTLFLSLAGDRTENAACVILSGTGSDGTRGLRAIKEHAGLTLAQADAEYDGMLHSALASGMVDYVLPASEMPKYLMEYFYGNGESTTTERDSARHLSEICAVLRARTGHDFSGYKERTISRRVQRRMQVLKIPDMGDFIDRLRKDARETELLLQDLLIGVTSFFRDPATFSAVEHEVIPRLLEHKGVDDTLRIWVPGCSTGEEAYSIAMLFRDHMPAAGNAPKLQIFASDIDEHALELARVGRYPASIGRDVSEIRLKRYFTREDGTFRVVSELREACLFSLHNVLRDAPFSKLDLISCRNLLIYLAPELQNRLIPLFHYALRDNGFLVLGTSENISRHTRLFSTIDKTHRIFQRRNIPDRKLPEFPLTATDGSRRPIGRVARPQVSDGTLRASAERQLLDRYAPAFVVINADGEILNVSDRTGKYLEFAAGVPSSNIFNMARPSLRLEMRGALHQAMAGRKPVIRENLSIDVNGGRQVLELIVHPLPQASGEDALYMMVFREVGSITPVEASARQTDDLSETTTIAQLEIELQSTKERLQITTEELESSNEELKSSNEELSSINEELQSANEELETSKEELQSINEELQTVNAELKNRVDELSRANSDIANLLESTQIATVFLNRELAIKSFTPAAKDVFRLVESDAGRPLSHVRSRLRLNTVEEDAERVLRTLATIEKQVESEDAKTRYIMRVMPYRTVDNIIAGLVITFIDVTRVAAAEARVTELTHDLRERLDSLRTLLDVVPVGVLIAYDRNATQIQVNRYGARLLGEDNEQKGPRQLTAPPRLLIGDNELTPNQQPLQRAAREGVTVPSLEVQLLRPDKSTRAVMISATPLLDEAEKPRGAIAAIVDISAHKRAEASQQVLLSELQHRVKNILATVSSLATRMLRTNPPIEEFAVNFRERLQAMAAMHELLSGENWRTVNLRSLAAIALDPYMGKSQQNVILEGPDILLNPKSAGTLTMALHELATNAAKYGALSSPTGRLNLHWAIDGDSGTRQVIIRWREHGGPVVGEPPAKDGFGTGFVKRSVAYELNGSVDMRFEPEGLNATITFPASEAEERLTW